MEKLLNLLNEYEEKRIKKINADWKLRVKLLFKPYTKEALTNQAYQSVHNEIISKYYWFIKRLVEKDKIDTMKLEKIWYEKTVCMYDWQYKEIVEYSDYESLLMLLSISDTPIEDLCGYLKDDATEKIDKLLNGAKKTCENIWI